MGGEVGEDAVEGFAAALDDDLAELDVIVVAEEVMVVIAGGGEGGDGGDAEEGVEDGRAGVEVEAVAGAEVDRVFERSRR